MSIFTILELPTERRSASIDSHADSFPERFVIVMIYEPEHICHTFTLA
jgi:hypothetical protein